MKSLGYFTAPSLASPQFISTSSLHSLAGLGLLCNKDLNGTLSPLSVSRIPCCGKIPFLIYLSDQYSYSTDVCVKQVYLRKLAPQLHTWPQFLCLYTQCFSSWWKITSFWMKKDLPSHIHAVLEEDVMQLFCKQKWLKSQTAGGVSE